MCPCGSCGVCRADRYLRRLGLGVSVFALLYFGAHTLAMAVAS
jgi:hypothetical protein